MRRAVLAALAVGILAGTSLCFPAPAAAAPTGVCDLAPGPLGTACDAGEVVIGVAGGAAGDAAGDAVESAVESGFDSMAEAFGKQAGELIVKVTTSWTAVPTTGAAQSDTSVFLSGQLAPITAFAAVIGVIIAATKMAISGRGQDLQTAAMGLFRMVVVTTAGTTVLALILAGGDEFSAQLIDASTEDGLNSISTVFVASPLGSALTFLLGLLAILTAIIQIGLLLVRSALLVVLVGIWPLSAAASIAGEAGAQSFKKVTGWIIAFALYKPAAAIVYAAAFKLMSTDGQIGDEALAAIQGLILLIMAVLALPAILRLVVPATAAMGGGMSTGAVAAGAMTAAVGAVGLAATGGASGAAAGASGASGASGAAAAAGSTGSGGSSGGAGATGGGSDGGGGSSGGSGSSGGGGFGGGGGASMGASAAGPAAAPAAQALDPATHDGDTPSGGETPSGGAPPSGPDSSGSGSPAGAPSSPGSNDSGGSSGSSGSNGSNGSGGSGSGSPAGASSPNSSGSGSSGGASPSGGAGSNSSGAGGASSPASKPSSPSGGDAPKGSEQ